MKKFGQYTIGDVHRRNKFDATPKVDQVEIKAKFWDWMRRHSDGLRRFHVLGGEPFFMPDFDPCLDHWDEYPNPLVEINVVSNLMVREDKFRYYIDRAMDLAKRGKIKRFDLFVTLRD